MKLGGGNLAPPFVQSDKIVCPTIRMHESRGLTAGRWARVYPPNMGKSYYGTAQAHGLVFTPWASITYVRIHSLRISPDLSRVT